ncbi:hypothetical protein [Amaricoccus sp.]|uniref:hypothetical protein n=1 Tax=Amaricoccus sp. TaxID=1872485 RepID=UPI001B624074|nr:hypothetical protein [Amaricoccus sp.]MBP7001376.1 hypothetical protein [Amaricoccus sp.]
MRTGMRLGLILGLLLAAAPAGAQGWTEPPRGSPERRALMDALRPFAVSLFGAPVEFVVRSLRVSGDVAFASVVAQRPGGGPIAVQATPGWAAGYFLPDADWTSGQALYRRAGGGWVAVEALFGATDVWWSDSAHCAAFRPVIADVCP